MADISVLQKLRQQYQPKLPKALKSGAFEVKAGKIVTPASGAEEIKKLFPDSYGMPLVEIIEGSGKLNAQPINVGVVLSGGQAPGGHNVIAGLLDALKAANPASKLYGFLGGPKGVITGKAQELTAEFVDAYRNTGGFDMIGSGRDKIEKEEDLAKCIESLKGLGVTALVVIGGDDSNTNAAVLAEHFMARKAGVQVIGIPKTIDGDMKNEYIEASFGFDTAAKTFAELTGNIARDSRSAKKYWHFIKLMGRAASHVALEVALQVRPNFTIISEEVEAKNLTLSQVVDQIADAVAKRAAAGKNYGVLVIPEGLLEFLSDFKSLLVEISNILRTEEATINDMAHDHERTNFTASKLTPDSAKVYSTLPDSIQEVLLKRDKHGNVLVSQIDTEKLLMNLVTRRLNEMKHDGEYVGSFNALPHFFGYEGRCVAPSNFDADYCYALGFAAAQLIRAGLSGYTVSATNLSAPAAEWQFGGVPVTSMLNMELRKGKMKPVIKKALVELEAGPFKYFASKRESWIVDDAYVYSGPIQYYGPSELCDALTETLKLEHKK